MLSVLFELNPMNQASYCQRPPQKAYSSFQLHSAILAWCFIGLNAWVMNMNFYWFPSHISTPEVVCCCCSFAGVSSFSLPFILYLHCHSIWGACTAPWLWPLIRQKRIHHHIWELMPVMEESLRGQFSSSTAEIAWGPSFLLEQSALCIKLTRNT